MNRAKWIDHTLLKPDVTEAQIRQLCQEAKEYGFASVCVNPQWVSLCGRLLEGTDVAVCTVVGFPLGANTSQVKAFETAEAVVSGAGEIDMVLPVGKLKAEQYDDVQKDIAAVVKAAQGRIVKVILETCLLTDEEIVKACELAVSAGADYVKTSTGFSSAGATVHHVALMKGAVKGRAKVKAAGGIRTAEDMEAMIAAGADRIGTSRGCELAGGNDERFME